MNASTLTILLCCSILLVSCDREKERSSDGQDTPEAARQAGEAQYEKAKEWAGKAASGTKEDFEQALEWTQKAARSGFREAQMTLAGLYYYGGKHVERDAAKARMWFERAAEQGSAEARFFLGEIYAQGDGVERDVDRAVKEWSLAAQKGVAEAEYRLGLFYMEGGRDLEQGIARLRSAAERAQTDAALALGKLYARGAASLGPDMKEAAKWYLCAAEGGSVQGQYVYGLMCLTGSGVPRDEKQGLAWLRLSAGRDYLPAVRQLSKCYRLGEGVEADASQADAWAERARELEEKEKRKPEEGARREGKTPAGDASSRS